MKTDTRLYESTNGELVREGDPRAAFLVAIPGDEVPERHASAFRDFGKIDESAPLATRAQVDSDARDELRHAMVGEDKQGKANEPPLMSERLMTELADEQRRIASAPAAVRAEDKRAAKSGAVVTERRLYRTDDGKLVNEGDANAAFLAYAAGDQIADSDKDAFSKLGKEDEESTEDSGDSSTDDDSKASVPADNKEAKPAANKATTVRASASNK
jgi:hypothetical protein